ncbi:aldehyde dehydrogenase family protein [Nocardioides marmoribigeumensis]|uniref:Acyl-CoA reductase-like NAD-dependent aldehyde dehydrogenase n=1 Tax=Nocardioides marmoribigeumensis TaxID=433649 RepID=A0ABU2BXR9_9ACTN|nr:aldehyde dehydrogenase family protein [Nocardioides marmoribigeumensis]MDR7363193.1 acyl-CoA reductase-like NAD-dependent aldehyde dehydrogenase [Nocardioides marmoribigeumensis]
MTATATATTTARTELLVDGTWRRPASGGVTEVENPATGEVVGTSAEGTAPDVDLAVEAARRAFAGWSTTALEARLEVLGRWAALLDQRRELLVETVVAEVGAPVALAREAHVGMALEVLGAYLAEAAAVPWEQRIGSSLVLREAVGVAACITPWNWPLYQVLAKIGGALVAGSTVVLKPAELTPLSAYLLADAALDAGLPAGVLNLVPGSGRVVGEAMVTHPDVDVVSFTGSTGVGVRISQLAAPDVKRVCLELGGKSASVVLPGADLDVAVPASVQGAMLNSGQTCSAWSRLLVPDELLPAVLERAAAEAEQLVPGDPAAPGTSLGPVVSAAQRATVTGFVERARAAGARVLTGGERNPCDRGHFVAPTVVTDVAQDAEIVQQEVFGPVLTIQGYADVDQAVALANDSAYGLHGAVWAEDRERALGVARRLRTGQVDVNGAAFNPAAPFGGYGRSGNGRELGRYGIEEFLETKSVQL